MSERVPRESALIRKIRSLPPDPQLTQAAAKLAEKAFRRVWDNPADAAYDRL
jgi:hypothetical protein